ncbi:MAG TPA: uracil phosphoribosyltransferase, partial [Treponemataceae bacterium]|nr:uracil phosphoribosyltransferase [Treponemataceae bacterium]
MNSKIILKAESLDGYLTEKDQQYLSQMDVLYEKVMRSFKIIASGGFSTTIAAEEKKVIDIFN